ncbi:hypothetical protein [Streptomyces sp. NRRL S-340]|uniref:hypothetical protein n=1 Tax=Streptomyces sp. NRRL S-340 TaxID=1463901 RepID=UPI00131C0325|nr:hypothetical protein [Streptomyces sp. NRRL S-340]
MGEDRLAQRRPGVGVQQGVGTSLLGVEQQEAGLGAQQRRVQQRDEFHGRALGQAEGGTQFGPLLVDAVVLAHLRLGLGDQGEDLLRAVGR